MQAAKRAHEASSSEDESEDDEFNLRQYVLPAKAVAASVDTRIDASNKGAALLAKMGYVGGGLGSTVIGRSDPVPFAPKADSLGLGRGELDTQVLTHTTTTQKRMASVLQMDETDAERVKREAKVAEKERLQAELAETLKTYRCDDCNKQYKNIRLYNEHLQSYDHHHRKRFALMKEEARASAAASGEQEKRREKERRREAKELERLGISGGMAQPPVASGSGTPPAESAKSNVPAVGAGGFKKLGSDPTSGSAPPIASTSAVKLSAPAIGAPTFRSSGYTTLDTGSSALPTQAAPTQSVAPAKISKPGFASLKPPAKGVKTSNAFGSDEDEPDVVPSVPLGRPHAAGRPPGGIKISLKKT